jgi:predicted nuclease of predicted toxin-antitoxin system
MSCGRVNGQRIPALKAFFVRRSTRERVVVTLDKDFGELAIVRRISHRGIIRLVNQSA